MKYTLQTGVEHPFSEKFSDKLRFSLPLLAILLLVVFLGFNGARSHQSPKPLTLGIYTVKTPDNSASSSNTPDSSSDDNNASSSVPISNYQPVAPVTTSNLQGGRGAVDSATTSAQDTATSTGSTVNSGSVVCTNLLTTSQLCTACTPPLVLGTGQKAIVQADGTCAAIN